MTVGEIYKFLDERFPFSTALEYDNPGLLVGDEKQTVKGVFVCLDCTPEAIAQAEKTGANLIVTHHPVIFDPIKSVTADSLVYRLIQKDISVISAHTNLDAGDGGVNDCLCEAVGLRNVRKVFDHEGFAYRVGEVEAERTAAELAADFGQKLGVRVRFVGNCDTIKTVAVCSGSGGSMLEEVMRTGVDAYLTADVKHDVFMDAHAAGFTIFDAGHFATEDVVIEPLCSMLKAFCGNIPVSGFHFSPIKMI